MQVKGPAHYFCAGPSLCLARDRAAPANTPTIAAPMTTNPIDSASQYQEGELIISLARARAHKPSASRAMPAATALIHAADRRHPGTAELRWLIPTASRITGRMTVVRPCHRDRVPQRAGRQGRARPRRVDESDSAGRRPRQGPVSDEVRADEPEFPAGQVRSLARYARVSAEALQRHREMTDPARRRA